MNTLHSNIATITRRAFLALALVLVVGGSALFWASRDYTVSAPEWDGQVRGIAYNPSRLFAESDQRHVSPDHIARDMEQLSPGLREGIRTLEVVEELYRQSGYAVSTATL